MKNVFFNFALCVATVSSLIGCGSTGSSGSTPSDPVMNQLVAEEFGCTLQLYAAKTAPAKQTAQRCVDNVNRKKLAHASSPRSSSVTSSSANGSSNFQAVSTGQSADTIRARAGSVSSQYKYLKHLPELEASQCLSGWMGQTVYGPRSFAFRNSCGRLATGRKCIENSLVPSCTAAQSWFDLGDFGGRDNNDNPFQNTFQELKVYSENPNFGGIPRRFFVAACFFPPPSRPVSPDTHQIAIREGENGGPMEYLCLKRVLSKESTYFSDEVSHWETRGRQGFAFGGK